MTGSGEAGGGPSGEDQGPRRQRPLPERLGLAAVAIVIAVLFGVIAVASWVGGEGFLAVMAGTGAIMTLWAGAMTVLRG